MDTELPEDYDPTMDMEHLHELEVDKFDKRQRKLSQSSHDVFTKMSETRAKRLSVPRADTFTRKDVMMAFQESFELIGGIPRLAAWAHENPTKFYELYSKLFPSENKNQVTHDGIIQIQGALQPTSLDAPPPQRTIPHQPAEPINVTPIEQKEKVE